MDVPVHVTLTDKQISDIETSLNTNRQANDALIAAQFSNSTDKEFHDQLEEFIRRKKEDISSLCQKYSDTFGKSIDSAQKLEASSKEIKGQLNEIEQELNNTILTYREHLQNAVKIRQDINACDEKIRANLEFSVLVQKLENINKEIDNKNYYIATVRALEFANYDSPISTCQTIIELQKEVDPIIAYVENQAEQKMLSWIRDFNEQCFKIGDAFLKEVELPPMDMSPIYEFYMIEKQLGKTELFLSMYNEKREKQLRFIRESKKLKEMVPDTTDFLFGITAGFFYTELRISSDGFNLLEPARAKKLWTETIEYLKREFNQEFTNEKIEDWINLSKKISHFDERMSVCSLNSSALQDVILRRGRQFKNSLQKIGSTQILQIIKGSKLETLRAKSNDELTQSFKYQLCEPAAKFPCDMAFIPEIPTICEIIESTLKKWIDFSLVSQDQLLVELYEGLVKSFSNAMKKVLGESTQIPFCGNIISSLSSFYGALNYFEQFLQKSMASNVKQDKEKLRRVLYSTSEEGVDKIATLFARFTDELLDSYYMRDLVKEPPPHGISLQLVMYLETMSSILQTAMPQKLFQLTIEKVAKHISDTLVKLIISMDKINWTPEYISVLGQNVNYIGNWSTLTSIPSAKAYLIGLVKMLSLLTSNQLATYSSDPNFVTKNQDIPFNAMVKILQRYQPVPSRNATVMQPNLVNSLIQKFTPYVHD